MDYNPRRRKDDSKWARARALGLRIFAVIGIATTISLTLMTLTLTRLADYTPPSLPAKMVLTYTFDAKLAESVSKPSLSQPLLRPAVTFHEITHALTEAAKDARVEGFVAKITGFNLSLAQVQELRSALATFRAAGKFAYIYADSYGGAGAGMSEYYAASAFDEIWIQPVGSVAVGGIAMQVPFLKGLLDQIGVRADFLHKGIYKSAPESLTETTMTGPSRENLSSLLESLNDQVISGVAQDRKLTPAQVRDLIDGAFYTDKSALQAKLVDRIGYYDEMIEAARTRAGLPVAAPQKEELEGFVDILGYNFVTETRDEAKGMGGFMTQLMRKQAPKSALKDRMQIALIEGHGEIIPYKREGGGLSEDNMTASKIAAAFRSAARQEDVAAIVLRIDSPGGTPEAAETIHRAMSLAKKAGKPVVVSMGSAAASGGYWVASAADKIIAQPATLTGSIGVFGGKIVIAEFLQKIGVNFETFKSAENADMWSSMQAFTPAQRAKFDQMMNNTYESFLERVAQGRNLSPEKVQLVAQGRVFTGAQAKENGLVDELGGLDMAIDTAKKLSGLEGKDVPIVRYPPRKSTLELFIELATRGAVYGPVIDMAEIRTALGLVQGPVILAK